MPLFFRRAETLLCALAILAGLILRLWRLDAVPGGLDIDEAAIVYWGDKFWTEGKWWAYAPEGAAWENLPGVLFSGLHRMLGLPERFSPTLFCFLELGLFFALARRWLGIRAAWLATALLAVCPWHLFYSRVVGTCTGLAFFLVWALYANSSPSALRTGGSRLGTALRHAVGLLYYTPYRLVIARLGVEYVVRRRWRSIGVLAAGGAFAAAAVFVSSSPFRELFTRGSYNFTELTTELPRKVAATWSAPFLPLSDHYLETGPGFVADRVHAGLAVASAGHPALGWGLSLLALVGIATALGFAVWKRQSLPEWLKVEGTFLLVAFAALSLLGPQLSRLLTFVPLIVLVAVWGLETWPSRLPAALRFLVVAAVIGTTAWSSRTVMERFADRGKMDNFFYGYHRDAANWVAARSGSESIFLLAITGYQAGRYWADQHGKYQFLPPMRPREVASLLQGFYSGQPQEVVVPGDTPEAVQFVDELRGLSDRSDETPIVVDQRMVGRILTLHWPAPRVARF